MADKAEVSAVIPTPNHGSETGRRPAAGTADCNPQSATKSQMIAELIAGRLFSAAEEPLNAGNLPLAGLLRELALDFALHTQPPVAARQRAIH